MTELRFQRRLPHPVERVWRAVSEPDELERWFVARPDWSQIDVTERTPPHVLAWNWGPESFRFELRADGDATVLTFTHVVADPGLAAQHSAGWEAYFDRLAAHVDGGFLAEEEAHQVVGELHERYAVELGVDPAPGRRTFARQTFRGLALEDGPQLRLVRRYRASAERLWHALVGEQEDWMPSDAPMKVVASEPPRRLVAEWFGDTLTFEIAARDDGGCTLTFTHAFEDRDTAARTAAGWDRCFARIDALLAGAPLGEAEALEHWLDVHDRYAEAFGVDPALGHAAYAQHPLT